MRSFPLALIVLCGAVWVVAGCARQAPPPPSPPVERERPSSVVEKPTSLPGGEPTTPIVEPPLEPAADDHESRIGLLLPLTGTRSELGRRAANAARLAVIDDPIELFVRDTAGDPFQAVLAVKELITVDDVDCIVGPLLSEVAVGAAAVAEALSIPLLSPTATDPRVAGLGQNIFQMNVSTAAQGTRMAHIAADLFLCRSVAIVHANTSYGETVSAAFREAFEGAGGTVSGTESYASAAPIFEPIALRIKELRPDGVFMPMPASHVARLTPLLLFHDVHAALLGSNGWVSDELLGLGDQYVGGAVFTAPFNEHAADPATRFFVRRYREAYGGSPDLVAAYAYDCVRALVHFARDGADSPAAFRERLVGGLDFVGTTGPMVFDENGRSVAEPRVVSLHGTGVYPVGNPPALELLPFWFDWEAPRP